ncbi:uncharacterized protein LOC111374314 [Olea europaea var. sylvestris]|uniref:uncharacterized protein LOC111374314 n=1 Tax=Olea europaea var. sylvestris TaxID=158386 RepID=UPI000C1D3EA3|nr:uncharacterized protein LOC111374314 [Olea europaea var. sylvestris]
MMPKLISWNVRGLNEVSKMLGVRHLLRGWGANLVCLQETKMEFISRAVIRSLWGERSSRISVFGVIRGFRRRDGFRWMFTRVYGPNSDDSRVGLWDELTGMRAWWNLPTCIGGDFNVIRFPSERSSGGSLTRAMEEFSDFIRENLLVDLSMIGGDYTWSSNRDRPILSRTDRFLICGEWESKYSDVTQRRLGRVYSDHFPIMLSGNRRGGGRRPFRFEKMWLKKLKVFKGDLKKWNEEVVGNVNYNKNQCLSEIDELDRREESQGLTGEENERHRVLKEEMERLVEMEEINWRHKSRVTWLKEGDKCTKFFHRVANSNRRNNSITVLEVDGVTYEEPQGEFLSEPLSGVI